MIFRFCLSLILALGVSAQTLIEPRVASETLPSGGLMQIKLGLTSPHPITTSGADFAFDSAFDGVEGVAIMSVAGDAYGVAVVQGQSFRSQLVSPRGSMGLQLDYPFLMIATNIKSGLPLGQTIPIDLGSSTYFVDTNGVPYVVTGDTGGVLTIGGSVSISNVIPGGGLLPVGTVIRVLGTGFRAQTKLTIGETDTSNARLISSNEMHLILTAPANLTGKQVRAKNPDNSEAVYYSYTRALPVGASSSALLNSSHPLFAMDQVTAADLPLPDAPAGGWVAIALRNEGLTAVNAQVELIGGTGASFGIVSISLPSGSQWLRTVTELFGAPPPGAFLRISAPTPIQLLGLRGDEQSGAVTAFTALGSPLTVNPAALSFNGPGTQTVSIGSTGSALAYSVVSSSAWLTAAPAAGQTPASITVTCDPSGLAPGSYNGTLSISSPGFPPQSVNVLLKVSSGQSLTISPSTLNLNGDSSARLSVSSRGNPQTFSVSTTAPWLQATPVTGQTPEAITVSANTAGLAPGQYTAAVLVGAQQVPVTLTVPVPVDTPYRFNPASVSFNYTMGGSVPRPQNVTVTGGAKGSTFTVSDDQSWMNVAATRTSAPGSFTVTLVPQGLPAGTYSGSVTVTPSIGKPQTVPVQLVVR